MTNKSSGTEESIFETLKNLGGTEHYSIPDTTFILSCERLLFTVYTL